MHEMATRRECTPSLSMPSHVSAVCRTGEQAAVCCLVRTKGLVMLPRQNTLPQHRERRPQSHDADRLRRCCHLPHAVAPPEHVMSSPGRWRPLPHSAFIEHVENHQNRRKRCQAAVVTVAVMPRRLQAVPFLPADRHRRRLVFGAVVHVAEPSPSRRSRLHRQAMEIAVHAIPPEVAGKPSSLHRSPPMLSNGVESLSTGRPLHPLCHRRPNSRQPRQAAGDTVCRKPSRRKTPSCRHRCTTARLRACLVIETPSTSDAFTLVAVSEALPMFT
uniref:Uncharacterized protein n=1 Tax=Oryza meridionalis TaxID=40149 RepID=A0A0E0E3Z1_9ORYZ